MLLYIHNSYKLLGINLRKGYLTMAMMYIFTCSRCGLSIRSSKNSLPSPLGCPEGAHLWRTTSYNQKWFLGI